MQAARVFGRSRILNSYLPLSFVLLVVVGLIAVLCWNLKVDMEQIAKIELGKKKCLEFEKVLNSKLAGIQELDQKLTPECYLVWRLQFYWNWKKLFVYIILNGKVLLR